MTELEGLQRSDEVSQAGGLRIIGLDKWSEAAAAITGITVMMSVLYNWSYFEVAYPAGMQLLTISDHVSSALTWLPGAILTYLVGAALNTIIRVDVFPRRDAPTLRPRVFVWAENFFWAALLAVPVLLAQPTDWWGCTAVAGLVWLRFVLLLIARRGWKGLMPVLLLIALPWLISASLIAGDRAALADFSATKGNATILLTDGASFDDDLVLRQLEKGVLVRNLRNDNVSFFRWEVVQQLTTHEGQIDHRWRSCIWFGLFCGDHRIKY